MNEMKRVIKTSLTAVVLLVLISTSASAQIIFGQPPSARAEVIYQSWKITDSAGVESTLSQWVVPVSAYVPLADNWEMMLSSSTAGTSLDDPGGPNNSLSGLNDTRIVVYRSLMDDRLMLGAGLNLPTGRKALDEDEIGVANLLTESFLNMPIRNYGEGFGVNLELGYAEKFDIYTLGAGAGYTYKGSYEPLNGADDYKPGDQFRLGAFGAVERGAVNARLSMRLNMYATDQLDGEDVFKDGSMFEINFRLGYVLEKSVSHAGIRYLMRGKHDRLILGDLQTEPEKTHGNELLFYGRSAFRMTEVLTLFALVEYTNVASNGYEEDHERFFGSSNYFGIGAGGSALLTDIFSTYGEFKYLTGAANDDLLDLNGYEIAVGVRAVF